MSEYKIKIPDSLPNCQLINYLVNKSNSRNDIAFNFIGQLDNFHQKIRPVIGQINLLFPEYTPHDDQYHIQNLFHLADKILGEGILKSLNSAELFLLACSLFGHDWGMAVSESDKQNIMSGQFLDTNKAYLLQDRERLLYFLSAYQFAENSNFHLQELSLDKWREFVRQTHCVRSADRIVDYFSLIDTGVAQTLSQICQSHGDSCQTLQNQKLYPVRCSVLGEDVNIRAIAIYLRLIDLFDIADNRTPYALWKYISPTDPTSINEWAKHRAIRQITTTNYPNNNRHIIVECSTNDHELYADLLDLENYCRNELRDCLSILSEMPENKYYLDIVDIDWNIKTDGFNPLPIRFEFDRERMLGFLSHELYQGDKLVFLRELLQNSIDAIRLRRELLISNRDSSFSFNGYIEVFADKLEDGSISFTWKDNGIGMDEKTITHFLSKVGYSYYQSDDFKQLNLSMDPISEFGIGLLTCFTVSNELIIETRRDPNIFNNSKPLKITIPSISRYFRFEEPPLNYPIDPGTIIKMNICKTDDFVLSSEPLIVTDYLSKIAGFVEFPILVHENDNHTIILHPDSNPAEIQERFGSRYDIKQLSLDHSLDDLFFSDDTTIAGQIFTLKSYNLSKDFEKLNDYEGVLSYPIPLDNDIDFTKGPRDYNSLQILISKQSELVGKLIRINNGLHGQIYPEMQHNTQSVYRDGILIPNTEFVYAFDNTYSSIYQSSAIRNLTRLVVNIPKSKSKKISLSRYQLITDNSEWINPIFNALIETLKNDYSNYDLDSSRPHWYLFRLASFMLFHGLSIEQLNEIFPSNHWPLPFLYPNGIVTFKPVSEIVNTPIYRSPNPLSHDNAKLIKNIYKEDPIPSFYKHWQGNPTLIDLWATWGGSNNDSIITNAFNLIIDKCINNTHRFDSIAFLTPPWNKTTPLLQEIWVPKIDSDTISAEKFQSVLHSILDDPTNCVELEDYYIQQMFFEVVGLKYRSLRLSKFQQPFEHSFAYGDFALNINHKNAQALLYILLLITYKKNELNIPLSELNNIKTILNNVFRLPGAITTEFKSWSDATTELWNFVKRNKLNSKLNIKTLTVDIDEFVPGSTDKFLHMKVRGDWGKDFGKNITSF